MISVLLARSARYCSMLLLAGAFACLTAGGQVAPEPIPLPLAPVSPVSPAASSAALFGSSADQEQMHIIHNMMRERNLLRQKEIVADTNHLLELAKQLKADVDKSNKDQLSLSVVNTASEMEKLAKAVKEKMRDGQ